MAIVFAVMLQVSQPSSTGDSTTVTTAAPAKPKRICRSIEHSGSMFRDRVCKTAEEWRATDESATGSDDVQTLQRGAGNPKPE